MTSLIPFLLASVLATSFISGVLSLAGGSILMGIFGSVLPVLRTCYDGRRDRDDHVAVRLGAPEKKSHEGTGLGLPLAAGLMAAPGGSLSIDSRPHEGSTVRLILPRSQIVKQAAE